MQLVMTLLVRDEEDILRANLDAHLSLGVDRFVITDNRSVDGTAKILDEYERLGHAVVLQELSDDYAQAVWVTRMARLAASELGADWVINADADEFWLPSDGDLKSTLEDVPEGTDVIVARRSDFVPRPVADPVPFHERMVIRKARSVNANGRPLPPKVCHRARSDISIEQGNHRVRAEGLGERLDDGRIQIAHFPLRSLGQLRNKIEKGGAAYERNRELPSNIGSTWRRLHERLMAGTLDAWYAEQELDDDEVEAGIEKGSLIVDTRVRNLLHEAERP